MKVKFPRARVFPAGFLLFVFSAVALPGQPHAADPFAENVRTTEPQTPGQEQKSFHLPPGFEIQLVAAEPDLRKPMNLAFDAQGRLWITESREYPFPAPVDKPARDTIRIFSDFDETGRARKVTIFAEGQNIPIGLYPFLSRNADGRETWKCIAWSIPNIWLFEDTDGDGKADKKEVLYGPFDHTRDTHGNQASFRRGFDGWLYATHGFNNDSHVKGRDGHQVDLNSGNTYRMRLDGSRIEQHTHGQVNPFGLAWDPLGNLYSSDCHSAPTYQLLAGGYYPSFGKPHDGLGFAPVLMEHSHGSTAIDGMVYYGDDFWPEEFRDNTFLGNVMTSRVNRDKITFNGSSPRATEMPDFVTCDDPWFRPVDNQLGPDGAFYIADFYNRIIGHYEVPLQHPGRDRERGRIWRVIYTTKRAAGVSPADSAGKTAAACLRSIALPNDLDGLIGELGSPNLTRRMLAMNTICDRFGNDAVQSVTRAIRTAFAYGAPPEKHATRANQIVHLLWALNRLGGIDEDMIETAALDQDSRVRVHAQRLLAATSRFDSKRRALALAGLKDPDALVQRCAAEVLGNHPQLENLAPLLELRRRATAADTHLLYVVRKAIRDQLDVDDIFSRILDTQWSDADLRTLAEVAVAVKSPLAGTFLLRNLSRFNLNREALATALQHAARYAPPAELDLIAAFAQQKFADDLDFQLTLFNSVEQGFQQRGANLSHAVRDWGEKLCMRALSSASDSGWWNTPLEGMADPGNPWAFQERPCADGQKAHLLSSHPLGESLTGALRSPPFVAPKTLSFFLAGHDGFPDKPPEKKNIVRLRDAGTGAVLAEAWPPRNDTAQKITWDLVGSAGRQVYLEATDGDPGGAFAWLAFGRFDPAVIALPAVAPGQSANRQHAAADLASKLRLESLAPQLKQLASGKSTDVEVRVAAAGALGVVSPGEAAPILSAMLADSSLPSSLRVRAGESLSEQNSVEARAAVLRAIQTAPQRLQVRLAQTMAGNAVGAETLLAAMESGQISPKLISDRSLKQRLLAAKPVNADTRLGKLTKDLPPANDEIQRLIEQRRTAYDGSKAATAKGEAVFTQNCRACHQIDGVGNVVGPQLDGIGNRGLERLLEDVLDPNRNVDPAFHTTNVSLKDGDVVSGLFRREEGEAVVLADSTGKERSIPKSEIIERRASDSSLMPENFGEIISPEDFNNLLAFLLAHGPRPAGSL